MLFAIICAVLIEKIVRFFRLVGTAFVWILYASPSIIALFPIPFSPYKIVDISGDSIE